MNSSKVKIARIFHRLTILVAVGAAVYWAVRVEGLGRRSESPAERMRRARAAIEERSPPFIPPPEHLLATPILPGGMEGGGLYESSDDPRAVEAYYRRILAKDGWREEGGPLALPEDAGATFTFARGGHCCKITLCSLERGQPGTAVMIQVLRAIPGGTGKEERGAPR
ncbi:MAG: hypothetical protein V1918_08265 [Planctomycetota bacterium]